MITIRRDIPVQSRKAFRALSLSEEQVAVTIARARLRYHSIILDFSYWSGPGSFVFTKLGLGGIPERTDSRVASGRCRFRDEIATETISMSDEAVMPPFLPAGVAARDDTRVSGQRIYENDVNDIHPFHSILVLLTHWGGGFNLEQSAHKIPSHNVLLLLFLRALLSGVPR